MIGSRQDVFVVMAHLGRTRRDDVVGAMHEQGWNAIAVDDLDALLVLAESGRYHVAVVVSDSPQDMPRVPVRALMSLQTDMAVMFMVPDRKDMANCPALVGATSDQLFDLDCQTDEMLDAVRAELRSVISGQEEYVVMCIDDDGDFLTSLEAFLPSRLAAGMPQFDLDFQCFIDPQEALSAAEEVPPGRLALVISDQVMPQMEGIELLARIRQRRPGVRRVLLTGHAGLDSAVTAINAHVLDRYYFKPIEEPAEFASNIQQLLREYCLSLRAEAQRHRLMAQFEFIRAISAADNPDKALAITVQFLQEQLGPQQIIVALMADGELAVGAGARLPAQITVGTPLPADGSICGWVLRHRRPILAASEDDLPCPRRGDFPSLPLVAAPMVWGDTPTGALLVAGGAPGQAFSRAERMLLSFVADIASVAIGGLTERRNTEQYYVETMACLMETVEAKDGYTRGHTDRVTELAVALARTLQVSGEDLDCICRAAALHDIGKIAIPDSIMLKPAQLDREEYAIMKEHSAKGDRILQHLKFLGRARRIIRSHHERYDGRGYPDALAGEDVPAGARILAIADSYDAMTSARPYRDAMDPDEALLEIERNAGTQFDPGYAAAFVEMVRAGGEPGQARGVPATLVVAAEAEH